MTKEMLNLSCSPSDEPCAQINDPEYQAKAIKECQAYIRQLRRVMGEPPAGARLKLRYNPHDFGTYLSVVIEFDPRDEIQVEYAYKCDAEAPANWDAEARAELELVTAP